MGMSGEISIIDPKNPNQIVTPNEISKRLVAEAMRRVGVKEFFAESVNKNISYADYLALMIWDAVTEGTIMFADGTTVDLRIDDVKIWLDTVKFIASHLDGPVQTNTFQGVNIFKVYAGIDDDRI
jgi:hypothetical protein